VSLCQPLQEFLRFYHKILPLCHLHTPMLACILHYQNIHQFCLQFTNNDPVTTHILWATICLLIINWSQSSMILEEWYLLKILPFIVIYFAYLLFPTVGRYSFYTSKSSELWLVQNPEFHVKVCFKNMRLYLYHDNIHLHSKKQPTNSLNKIQYNTKCNIWTHNSHGVDIHHKLMICILLHFIECICWLIYWIYENAQYE
jgi:hypothetical protein